MPEVNELEPPPKSRDDFEPDGYVAEAVSSGTTEDDQPERLRRAVQVEQAHG